MERTKRDLEAVINSQKEQLARYEKRLKDVVTAYKGLLKEKEALESSFTAVTTKKEETESESCSLAASQNSVADAVDEVNICNAKEISDFPDKGNLQGQIATLMNSLATLSAEKSRMEASFQADKKILRAQMVQKEQTINDLKIKMKETQDVAKADVEEVKAKWIIERQEREKETNNQMLIIRELQKLYADERHLKENIEMQLNNFKMQFASNESENSRLTELQSQLKEAKGQLKLLQVNKSDLEASTAAQSSTALLRQLQQEMQQLKEQHAIAISNEQRRVQMAEEQSRKQAVLHEDRVAKLESRLSELSTSVGTYDRLRHQDQESIQHLKKQIHDLERTTAEHSKNATTVNSATELSADWKLPKERYSDEGIQKQEISFNNDMANIVDDIIHLKKILLQQNARSSKPIDLAHIFTIGADHTLCREEMKRTSQELETLRPEVELLQGNLKQHKEHISTLQEKVKVLNRNIDDQDVEIKHFNEKLCLAVKDERAKWKTLHAEMENENRCKLNDLEQQLQKQRQRSLQLLDEKEQEIKALQTSFEILHSSKHPGPNSMSLMYSNDCNNTPSSDAESIEESSQGHKKITLKGKKLSIGESCHMLHYANEIARKDIEIANLRKAKYQAETSLRKAIHEKVTAQEELSNKIEVLEEQVDRLERCKTREGANLEYLKNVIISYIVSKDSDGKRHMMNAISAVLQFTTQETQIINEAFHKK